MSNFGLFVLQQVDHPGDERPKSCFGGAEECGLTHRRFRITEQSGEIGLSRRPAQCTQCSRGRGSHRWLRIASSCAKQLHRLRAAELANEVNGRCANLLIRIGQTRNGNCDGRPGSQRSQRFQRKGPQWGLGIV
jgi:hypothetical protein